MTSSRQPQKRHHENGETDANEREEEEYKKVTAILATFITRMNQVMINL